MSAMSKDDVIALGGGEYLDAREMPDGTWIVAARFLFTYGLLVGVDEKGYRTRYCYAELVDCLVALHCWDGVTGDPPGPWIKQKPEERLGPGATDKDLAATPGLSFVADPASWIVSVDEG